MSYRNTLHHKTWYQSALCHFNYIPERAHVRLQFRLLSEHNNHTSGRPPDSRIWQEIKVISRCSVWCQPCVCVHTNRCGAGMTDNLSTKRFYLTHLSAVQFLLSQAALMTSLSGSDSTLLFTVSVYTPMYCMYIWVFNLTFEEISVLQYTVIVWYIA